jgi:hypothetical protein
MMHVTWSLGTALYSLCLSLCKASFPKTPDQLPLCIALCKQELTQHMWRWLALAVFYFILAMASAAASACPGTPVPPEARLSDIKFSPTVAVGKRVSYAGGKKGRVGEVHKVSPVLSDRCVFSCRVLQQHASLHVCTMVHWQFKCACCLACCLLLVDHRRDPCRSHLAWIREHGAVQTYPC